jgi:flagellar biosynthetic protein FlhB
MAEEGPDKSQKTEEPTQKRLDDSRTKGQVASSKEINHWFLLLGGTIMVVLMAPGILRDIKGVLRGLIAFSHDRALGAGGIGVLVTDTLQDVAGIMLVPLGLLMVMAALSSLVQNLPGFALESIKPKLEKISPGKGAKRLFSSRSVVEFLKGLLKLTIVGTVATLVVMPEFERIEQLAHMSKAAYMGFLWAVCGRLLIVVLAVMTVIAGLDYLYQKMQHTKQMRMNFQEIKDEHKQTDGDPMVKARLRQIRTERARHRMMQAVPDSTVVITNPTHFAIALKYDTDDMDAPEVIAKGADLVAKRIREVAQENGVPLVENPPLARALYASTKIGQTIPPEHYRAVAEVIGYVMRLKKHVTGRR